MRIHIRLAVHSTIPPWIAAHSATLKGLYLFGVTWLQTLKIFFDCLLFVEKVSNQLDQDVDPSLLDVLIVTLKGPLHNVVTTLGLKLIVLVDEALPNVISLHHVCSIEQNSEF